MTNDHDPTSDLAAEADSGLLEILSRYTQTFMWLQCYDEGMLTEPTGQSGGTLPSETQASAALAQLKAALMARSEATALFAQPRGDGLGALLGNLDFLHRNGRLFGKKGEPVINDTGLAALTLLVAESDP